MLEQGYGIMPNKVLFDESLSSTTKLVFCLISSLTAQTGKCWANNEYIGNQLHISKSQVSRSIKQLEEYILIDNPFNEKRSIRLRKNAYVVRQKCVGSLRKNAQHNTITNIINKNSISSKDYFKKFYPKKNMPDLG